ncbi:hypothetical protein SAMN02745126_02394 [Enhydrobacter aerosaccus]|uniref:Uncharacterized protein n=2 Tax=Enhydrobacter aerosaccus TaxID=225324 RepID=A0A1T4NQE3_9HYPH|nr:hypothetical protein SAMN02745126_02394 [Enhydrobacter aerosaccus]
MKFGSKPQIAFPQILARDRALSAPIELSGLPEISTSRDGERVAYIARSLSEDARAEEQRKHPKRYSEPHRYDLFVIEGEVTRQVTHLETYMSLVDLSYSGTTAAIGLSVGPMTNEKYVNRSLRTFEPAIVDINTGAVTRTDLIARVNANPQFAPVAAK